MCNLNIFIKTNDFLNKDLSEFVGFFNSATYSSFINNHDGEGAYFDNKGLLITSPNKINFLDYFEEFNKSNFIITHQRYTTSGRDNKYTHPFKRGDFILVHNGVMSDWAKGEHSDTYMFFKRFEKKFNSINGEREFKIIKCIKDLLRNEGGSYSMALFDELTKRLYYFKNDGSNINVVMNKEKSGLYISTAFHNMSLLDIYNEDFEEFDINNLSIYRIDLKNKGIKVRVLGKIPKRKKKKEKGFITFDKKLTLDDFKMGYNIHEGRHKRNCEDCGFETLNSGGEIGGIKCDDCLESLKKEFDYSYYEELEDEREMEEYNKGFNSTYKAGGSQYV